MTLVRPAAFLLLIVIVVIAAESFGKHLWKLFTQLGTVSGRRFTAAASLFNHLGKHWFDEPVRNNSFASPELCYKSAFFLCFFKLGNIGRRHSVPGCFRQVFKDTRGVYNSCLLRIRQRHLYDLNSKKGRIRILIGHGTTASGQLLLGTDRRRP